MADNKRFSADVNAFADLTKRKMKRVAVNSIQDVMEAAQSSAQGITAGGTLIEGKIPVVSSDLINSLVTSVNGGDVATGQTSYTTGLASFNIGDYMRFAWTMEYALRIEFGFTGTDSLGRTYNQKGWGFVSVNAAKWPEFVNANAAKERNKTK